MIILILRYATNSELLMMIVIIDKLAILHCVTSVRIWIYSSPNAGKYGPE